MTKQIKYLLDTDTCSYILRKKPVSVLKIFERIGTGNTYISVITYSELLFGAEKTKSQKINLQVIEDFCNLFSILDWDKQAAKEYSLIREYLERNGELIGNMDLMIAAHARSNKLVLISNNHKHFSKVPNLILDNWVINDFTY